MIKILFMAADPTDASRLRLGEELREIQEKLQLSKAREAFELHQRMSVRAADITQALLDINPDIVHFSGHGTSAGCSSPGPGGPTVPRRFITRPTPLAYCIISLAAPTCWGWP